MRVTTTILLCSVAVLTAILAPIAVGQPVEMSMSLERPGVGVAYDLDELYDTDNPRVTLVRPAGWTGQDAAALSNGRDAAYYWEIFLLGLQLPYRTIEADELGRGVPKHTRLLILPAADALGSRQRRKVLEWVDKGGALVTSGRLGAIDDRGRSAGDGFFAELLGAEYVSRVPEQPFGLLHSIDGLSPVAGGVEPGFRLNITAQVPLSAARVVSGEALGRPYSYSGRDDDRLADLSLMVGHDRGKGRVFWTRFNPQDVSRESEQQLAYQRMAIGAMAWTTRSRGAAIAPWPNGSPSALAVTTLPSVGFDALTYLQGWHDLLDQLRSSRTPATFFLSSRESAGFPDVIQSMHEIGEVAIAGEDDDVIATLPHDVQAQKLAAARGAVGMTGGVGVYPPGGFYDGGTVRAMLDGGFGYLLLATQESFAPGIIRWWDDVDYRALRAVADAGELPFLANQRVAAADAAGQTPADPVMVMPLDAGSGSYASRFARIHAAGGLYVLPYYPEVSRSGSVRARDLSQAIQSARLSGTWIATLGDIARWWSARSHVSIETRSDGSRGMDIDLQNDLGEEIRGLTLTLQLGDVEVEQVEWDGTAVDLRPGSLAGSWLAVIDRLPPGLTSLRLTF